MLSRNRFGTLCAVVLIVGLLTACSQPTTLAPSPTQAPSVTQSSNPTSVPSPTQAPNTSQPASPTATSSPTQGRGMMGRGMAGSGHAPGGLVAVGRDGKPLATDAKSQLPENTAAQKVGGLNVALTLTPYPPVSFQKGNFDVTLTDESGQAITDAKILLDLTMPAMRMPPNKPEAQHAGNGRYHATGIFTMRDWWRIEVIIQRGDVKQSAFFDVWV